MGIRDYYPSTGGVGLIDSFGIYKKAEQVKRRCDTNNVQQIADRLGIKIYYDSFDSLLGMYTYHWKTRIILLNNNLDAYMKQMVLAHEIGHDHLHRKLAEQGLKEFTLFDMKSITEYEANAFAAHLLLDNDIVYQLAMDRYNMAQMASILNSHMNLLLIKMQEMNRLGYDFKLPDIARCYFLKKVKI